MGNAVTFEIDPILRQKLLLLAPGAALGIESEFGAAGRPAAEVAVVAPSNEIK